MSGRPRAVPEDLLVRAARLLRASQYAVALTGAGLSTRSGIPDFRSPGSGLWETHDPLEVASIYAFRRNPARFYEWVRPLGSSLASAEPNAAHCALARLEERGALKAIVTQNIDGLHQRAGSQGVLELHGNLSTAQCMSCGTVADADAVFAEYLQWRRVPRCDRCAGVMKPNVVFIGEQLPADVVSASVEHLEQADTLLVAGSSLEMFPAADLPLVVQQRGGRLIIVNLRPTYLDPSADVLIRADVVEALPRVAALCCGSPDGVREEQKGGASTESPQSKRPPFR